MIFKAFNNPNTRFQIISSQFPDTAKRHPILRKNTGTGCVI